MSRKRPIEWIKGKLRDPIWQAIGAILALIAILIPLILASILSSPTPNRSKRIIINSQTSKDLADFSGPVGKQLRILIEGKEARDPRLFVFLVEYRGQEPIRSTDFETPIRGRISGTRRLINVQKAGNLEGPLRFDKEKGTLAREKGPPINFEVEVLDEHTFQIKPVLMNPGEWLGIEIYTAAVDETSPTTPLEPLERYKVLNSEISWSCHVADVQCPAGYDLDVDFDYMGLNEPAFLQVSINHQGWGVYLILLFTITNSLLLVLLAKTAGMQKAATIVQFFLFSIGTALSVASAEVATDWLITDRILGIEFDFGQPIYAYVIFWLDISVIFVLATVSIWKRKGKRVRIRRRVRPADEEVVANSEP